jgi:hypothetical protein
MNIEKHPMVDKQYNIKFIDNNNINVIISWAKNPLNGTWMLWSNKDASMYTYTKKGINILIKDIKKKYKVKEITI